MAYVKQIEDYIVKDEEARNAIETLTQNDATQTSKINELVSKTNANTENLASLTQGLNTTNSNVSVLQTEVEALKTSSGVTFTYDSANEKLTLS